MSSRTPSLFAVGATGRPVQRWAVVACWVAFMCVLPSVVWRIAMLMGVETGFAETDLFRGSTTGMLYVLVLDLVQVGAAALTLGLYQRWGERLPRWVPRLGGRPIPRLLPMLIGGFGGCALVWIIGSLILQFGGSLLGFTDAWTPADGMNTMQKVVLAAAYVPAIAWPVALGVALVGYWRRRTPVENPSTHRPAST